MHHMKMRKKNRFSQDIHHMGGGVANVVGIQILGIKTKNITLRISHKV
jgi:hypothetical protein